jgi:hypothetical protein
MSDQIVLTSEEQIKINVISSLLKKEIKTNQAAKMLRLSTRQVRRLKVKMRKGGVKAIVHGLKNKRSNRRTNSSIINQATKIINSVYSDFKPSFACEKLHECHQIYLSHETVRQLMIRENLWKPRHQKKTSEYRS